ncbi:MAG: hypothetical protein L0H55_16065, partial [Candidatus Nitrosocosmicus sp.]|nr:hypothetical protein [Candidatus Nitrosocosmicus sp.]
MKARIKKGYNVYIKNENEIEIRSGSWFSPIITLVDDRKLGKLESIISKLDGNIDINEISKSVGIEYRDIIIDLVKELSQR